MEGTHAVTMDTGRKETAIQVTRFLVHKHYCENDFLADESLFDDPFLWFGAAEQEFAVGRERVMGIFRQFQGQVPKCNITGEEYHAELVAPDVCLVVGRMWIATDPSTGVFIRVHQRITTCIRWTGGKAKCCHIHISNPYTEMASDDVGFPTRMAQQSRDYMLQQLEEQRKLVAAANAELASIYHTVPCGIIRLLRAGGKYRLVTFNRTLTEQLDMPEEEIRALDWSAGFSQFVIPEDIPQVRNALKRLRRPGDRSSTDYCIHTRSGRAVYVSCSNDFISQDEQGDIIQRLTYDITQRKEMEAALRRLSFVDTLTELFNRNRFNMEVAALSRRPPERLGVVCFDLNGLKAWNDRRGHLAGDMLIHRTGLCIARAFPGQGYRIGGDEFVVMDAERDEAAFQAALAEARAQFRLHQISISIGSCWRGERCDVWEQYDEADRTMYQEKQAYYRSTGKAPGGKRAPTA